MTQERSNIHKVVRERYAAAARAADATSQAPGCCDTSDSSPDCGCTPVKFYSGQLLEGLPADVTGFALGCGDPVTIASLQPGETVLDLGSGGGIDCFLAARQVGEEGYVIGVDMTPEMVARANANKARMGARNVEFRLGQIEALPVADGSVDVVMSNCVINLSPDKSAVFREAFRVLKPGGRVSISDIVIEGDFSPEMRAELDKWAECVTGAIDMGRYTDMMREAGFVDVQVVDRVDAGDIIEHEEDMPRILSARITGRKPT
jgi:arsenite methyltransferase